MASEPLPGIDTPILDKIDELYERALEELIVWIERGGAEAASQPQHNRSTTAYRRRAREYQTRIETSMCS